MLGVDDILDDAHWTNVQDPVRQMFSALTKAVRTQSAGMRDMDRKMSYLISKESAEHLVRDVASTQCSKESAIEIMRRIDTKADFDIVSALDAKVSKLADHMSKIGEIVQKQANAITDINVRLERACNDIEELKRPNYDHVFAYVDRQIGGLNSDVERKLSLKADQAVVDRVVPARMDEILRGFSVQLTDMKIELGRTATKEDFHALAATKAEGSEVRHLAEEVSERVTRQDLQQTVTQQVKPLVVALTSLERAVQIQQSTQTKDSTDMQHQLLEVIREQQELDRRYRQETLTDRNADAVLRVVEEALRDRGWDAGDSFPLTVQNSLTSHTETLFSELRSVSDSLRSEITASQNSVASLLSQKMDEQALEMAQAIKVTRESSMKTRAGLKELAVNVTKALSKKVDRGDLRKVLKEKEEEEARRDKALLEKSHRRERVVADEKDEEEFDGRSTRRSGSRQREGKRGSGESKRNDEFENILADWRKEDRTGSSANGSGSGSGSDGGRHPPPPPPPPTSSSSASRRSQSSSPAGRRRSSSSSGSSSNGRLQPSRLADSNSHSQPQSQTGRGVERDAEYDDISLELESLRNCVRSMGEEITALRSNLSADSVADIQRSIKELKAQLVSRTTAAVVGSSASVNLGSDWRLALGELSLNLRRELGDKTGREEMYTTMRQEAEVLEGKLHSLTKVVDKHASADELNQLQNELVALRSKVSGELTGARWLWTTGQVVKDGWIPWDTQVTNAAPAVLQWKRGATSITVRMPGLYRICVAVFTFLPVAVQICLAGEPMLAIQPASAGDGQSPFINAQTTKDDKYVLRRLRHSAGEVSCVCIDEHVSLPSDAELSVRFHSSSPAQAFFSIRKL